MSDPDEQAEGLAAWRTLDRVMRGAFQPGALAAALPDRRSLERELAAAELALIWFRAVAEACRDRLETEVLPDAEG